MIYKVQTQEELREYYLSHKWKKVKIYKYNGWIRDKIKNDILASIALQHSKQKISVKNVIGAIGMPQWLCGRLDGGMLIYVYRHSSDFEIGLYGMALFTLIGNVIGCGSNRLDSFCRNLAKRKCK